VLSPISAFPTWAIRKIGHPILTEADWAGTFPNSKYGIFASTTGTLAQDTANVRVGGAGSVKMLTAATSNDSTEVKYSHHYVQPKGWLVSMEMKWAEQFTSGGTNFHFGIENRDNANIRHARFRWTNATARWMYEDNALVYQDFPAAIGGPLPIERSVVSASTGSKWNWARAVIDPLANKYVGFEAAGQSGIETRDMRSMNLSCSNEGVSTAFEMLFFTLVTAGANAAEAGYTTDWVISIIPPTIDPFDPFE